MAATNRCKEATSSATARDVGINCKSFKPGDNVMVLMVPVPDLHRAKIDAHSLHAVIVEEYSNGQFKLGARYILTMVWNKISKLTINVDI